MAGPTAKAVLGGKSNQSITGIQCFANDSSAAAIRIDLIGKENVWRK